MAERPAFLADEMLGRLARYLRILGHDTEYVRGLDDDAVLARWADSPRWLLTRDVALAGRARGRVVRLTAVAIADQLREVDRAVPGLSRAPAFDRCTECNGVLHAEPEDGPTPPAGPSSRGIPGAIFRCATCGHRYWEGSHTARVRGDVARWLGGAP